MASAVRGCCDPLHDQRQHDLGTHTTTYFLERMQLSPLGLAVTPGLPRLNKAAAADNVHGAQARLLPASDRLGSSTEKVAIFYCKALAEPSLSLVGDFDGTTAILERYTALIQRPATHEITHTPCWFRRQVLCNFLWPRVQITW